MIKIKKHMLIGMLSVFKQKGCKTIDDIIEFLNKEIKDPNGVVFSWQKTRN